MAENSSNNKEKGSFFKNLPDTKDVAKKVLVIIVVTIILGVLIKLLDTGVQALLSLIA